MKNAIRILLLQLLFFTTFSGMAKVPKFGKQYYDWVTSQSNSYSRQMAQENFDLILNNFHNTVNMKLFMSIYQIDSLIADLEVSTYKNQELIEQISDPLEQNYLRGYYSRLNQKKIFFIESQFNLLESNLKMLDSVHSRNTFYGNGLYNIGSSHVLQSFTEVGDKFSHYLPEKYPFSISVEYNEGVPSSEGKGEAAAILGLAGSIAGSYIAGPLGTAIGGAIGSIIGGLIDYFNGRKKQKEAIREYRKQMEWVKKANEELPKHLLKSEQQYAIYKNLCTKYKEQFKETRLILSKQMALIKKSFSSLVAINLTNTRVSKSYLKKESLEKLKKKYNLSNTRNNILGYSGALEFISILNEDLFYVKGEVKKAKESHDFVKTSSILDLLDNNISFLGFIIDSSKYPLIDNELVLFQKQYQDERMTLINHLAKIKGELNRSVGVGGDGLKTSTLLFKYNYYNSSVHKTRVFVPLNSDINYQLSNPPIPVITYAMGEYSIGYNKSYYEDRVNNGAQNPMRDILGSSYDGGMKEYSVQASNEIRAVSRNLDERINRIKTENDKLSSISSQWRESIKNDLNSPIVLPERQIRLNSTYTSLVEAHSNTLQEYKSAVESLVKEENSSIGFIAKQKRLDLLSKFVEENPQELFVRSNSPLLEGYAKKLQNHEYAIKSLNRELGKSKVDVENGSHPTIKSIEDLELIRNSSNKLGSFIEALVRQNYPSQVVNHYVDEINKYRMVLKGFKVDLSIENNLISQSLNNNFESNLSDFKSCKDKNGVENCGVFIDIIINDITDKNSNGTLESVGFLMSNPNMSTQLSIQSIQENAFLVFDSSNFESKNFAIITPGFYLKPEEIRVTYVDIENPSNSKNNVEIKDVFESLQNLVVYQRNGLREYKNKNLVAVENKPIEKECYDVEIGYYQCKTVSSQVTFLDQSGQIRTADEELELAEEYLGKVQAKYGSNSNFIFDDLLSNKETFFQRSVLPEDYQSEEYKKLIGIVDKFHNSYSTLVYPSNMYKSQALNELVNLTNEAILLASSKREIDAIIAESQEYINLLIDLGTSITPGVNDARDLYELLTGLDFVTNEDIGMFGRMLAGGGLLIGSGALFRKIINSNSSNAVIKILKNSTSLRGFPKMKYIRSGKFKGSMVSDGGIIYRKSVKYSNGKIETHAFYHIVSKHHEWGRYRKIPGYKGSRNSRFSVSNPKEIVGTIDKGYEILKNGPADRVLKIKNTDSWYRPGSRSYLIEMNEVIGYRKNGTPMTQLFISFEENERLDLIRTAFPIIKN